MFTCRRDVKILLPGKNLRFFFFVSDCLSTLRRTSKCNVDTSSINVFSLKKKIDVSFFSLRRLRDKKKSEIHLAIKTNISKRRNPVYV